MSTNTSLLTRFYTAFQARDGAAMAACYYPDARFSDPVFPNLNAKEAGAMWQMLCGRGKDLRITFEVRQEDASRASVHWEAWYNFSATGRAVHNVINAEFELRDGLILHHHDCFDFHRWATQALGFKGWLLGSTGWLQRKVQGNAAKALQAYLSQHP